MKSTKQWRPPLWCRWFGCKFEPVDNWGVKHKLLPIIVQMERCKRCRCGRAFSHLFGPEFFTPASIDAVMANRMAIEKNETGNVVPLRRT